MLPNAMSNEHCRHMLRKHTTTKESETIPRDAKLDKEEL
jgi:hypothetical protein